MVQQVPPTGLSNSRPFRNKVINGDMQIFQRSSSAVYAPSVLSYNLNLSTV